MILIARRRELELALERTVEGGLGFVTSIQRNLKHEDEDKSVRGVNLMRVRNGQIVEALGYVKGA